MKTKKCIWCLKEFETENDNKYCSLECEEKSENDTDSKRKKGMKQGFFQTVIEVLTGWL